MCYHSQRREALARLEHETGLKEANDDRIAEREPRDGDVRDPAEEHHDEDPAVNRTQRPEPVGFA